MNKGCLVAVGVVILLAVIVGLSVMGMYNGVVAKDEACNKSWGNVESSLQRRFDLIPNLVNTVKGYAGHEKGILEEITRLRSQWGEAKTPAEKVDAASGLEGALGRLMVVVENYPELKANQNFIALQDELAGTENRINVERQRYNESVQVYNTAVRQMPTALVARLAGFNLRTPFEAAQGAEMAPAVQF
ncbi:MAG TPA: LemA family protein [Verrucomicrobia bacterium]|nr:LemA family protein [Verrucomicrobiota bacterium]